MRGTTTTRKATEFTVRGTANTLQQLAAEGSAR
jgi:hypothetical protein